MKKGNLYNNNSVLNKWEEENHLRNMRKKLENVKSTLPPGARAVSSAKGKVQRATSARVAQPSANLELDGMFVSIVTSWRRLSASLDTVVVAFTLPWDFW
jgi:hypothetical protein